MQLHGWGISVFPNTTVPTQLSVIIFTGRPFPHPTFTGARNPHLVNGIRGITIHITESKIHISYSENHDSTLILLLFLCHPFEPSLVSLLRVVLFRSVFLSMLLNLKINVLTSHRLAFFRSQCQWIRIFKSLTTPMAKSIINNAIYLT